MRKRITIIVFLMVSLFSLFSCTTNVDIKEEIKQVEITFSEGNNKDFVTKDLDLPRTPTVISSKFIRWESSDTDIISNIGEVSRPEEDTTVTLTAILSVGLSVERKEFEVLVIGLASYRVIIKNNIGKEDQILYANDNRKVTLPSLEIEGYEFLSLKDEDGLPFDSSREIYGPYFLYADYVIKEYTLSFDSKGGSSYDPIVYEFDQKLDDLQTPVRTGYEFKGWYYNNKLFDLTHMPAKNVKLEAKWKVMSYSITYLVDGSTYRKDSFDFDSKVKLPKAPDKIGHNFIGWDIEIPEYMPNENLVANAIFELKDINVTFMVDGIADVVVIKYGERVNRPADPDIDGREFSGWYIGDTRFNFDTVITEDLVITARFDVVSYEVKFVDYNGELLEVIEIVHGGTAVPTITPSRVGYTFIGWNKDITNVTEDLVVEAVYEINVYEVVFLDKEGIQIGDTQHIEYLGSAVAPTPPVVMGYTFNKWNKAFNSITENLTVQAIYDVNIYEVKFLDKDGIQIGDTQHIEYLGSAVAPTAPLVDGYTFVNWDKDYCNITSNLTLQAVYEINVYEVKFLDKDGVQIGDTQLIEYLGFAIAPTAPLVDGYTFVSWDKEFDSVIDNLTVQALYEINVYEVIFLDKDGVQIGDTQEVEYLESAVAPTPPEVDKYLFVKWDKDFSEVTSNLTVQAIYKLNVYEVKFLDKDGVQIGETQIIDANESALAPIPPTVVGYTFVSWDKEFDNVTEDLVVQAIYQINVYEVKFLDKDGTQIGDTQLIEYLGSAVAPLAPEVDGYQFTNWDKEFNNITGDLTVQAIYELVVYEITYILYDNPVNDPVLNVPDKLTYTILEAFELMKLDNRLSAEFSHWIDTSTNERVDEVLVGEFGNLTLKAVWVSYTYEVTFNLDGGDLISGDLIIDVIHSGTITFPQVEREGYELVGWLNIDGKLYVEGSIVNEPLELIALWSEQTYPTISDVIAASNNQEVETIGVVTGFTERNTQFNNYDKVWIEDNTGSIVVYRGVFKEDLQVGDMYIIRGSRAIFSGLNQIAPNNDLGIEIITEYVSSGNTVSNPINIEDVSTLIQAIRINTQGVVKSVSSTGQEMVIDVNGKDLVVRTNSSASSNLINTHFLGAIIGQRVNVIGVHVDWYNGPQLLPTSIEQIELMPLTTGEKLDIVEQMLVSEYSNKYYEMETEINLRKSSDFDSIITWTFDPEHLVDGTKWAVVTQDEEVLMVAKITIDQEDRLVEIPSTIKYIDESIEEPDPITEDFESSKISSSYGDGSFVSNGVTFTYGHSRDEGDYGIDGKGLMLRRASDSFLEFTLPDGFRSFSFQFSKAFTGTSERELEIIVNGTQIGKTVKFGNDDTVYTWESGSVNFEGPATIKIKNIGTTSTNRQTTIDNITWIPNVGGGVIDPSEPGTTEPGINLLDAKLTYGDNHYIGSALDQNAHDNFIGNNGNIKATISSTRTYWTKDANNTMRLGSNSATGNITYSFDGAVKISKVIIEASDYNGKAVSIKVGNETVSVPGTKTALEFELDDVSSFTIESVKVSENRLKIYSVTIIYET